MKSEDMKNTADGSVESSDLLAVLPPDTPDSVIGMFRAFFEERDALNVRVSTNGTIALVRRSDDSVIQEELWDKAFDMCVNLRECGPINFG